MEDKFHILGKIESERSDIITKLAKIEEKKTTVSFEIYEKVKKDYDKKLKEIEKKLAENIELVKAEVTRLKQEEADLTQQEKEIRLKIEEAELRYSIGEYDDENFHKLDDENKAILRTITDKIKIIKERMKWFESFVEIEALEQDVKVKREESLKIDEHILEEKTPAEEKKLDELLVAESAVSETTKEEKSKPPESAKLKKGEKGVSCPKCGYLNTPDSWYCEKCGAEILETPAL